MTLCEFSILPDTEKAALLYEQGVYIGKHRLRGTVVLLYQLEGFYVEIYYRQYRRSIEHMAVFADAAKIDPYLTEINVEHLV